MDDLRNVEITILIGKARQSWKKSEREILYVVFSRVKRRSSLLYSFVEREMFDLSDIL